MAPALDAACVNHSCTTTGARPLYRILPSFRCALAGLLFIVTVAAFGAEHRFAAADYVQGKVFIVAADGKVEWEHPAPSCNDLWALPKYSEMLFVK